MRNVILTIFFCSILSCCQKKESILETEKTALTSVFNSVADSVYLKSTGNKAIPKNARMKTLVIYDSLVTEKPSYVEFRIKFKTIKNLYFDTINEKISPKLDLNKLQKNADFKYKYSLALYKGPFPTNFWDSKYALPGFLIFSKITFDQKRKFGAFYCTYTNGDLYHAKEFLIYIEIENNVWKLKQVKLRNVMF